MKFCGFFVFFFKQKTAYEMRISDWSSDVCSSDLTEDPEAVISVDLNRHHVALNRLKHAAITHLPDFESFFRFFGEADHADNIAAYDRHLAPRLDPETRAYWGRLTWRGRGRKGVV